MKYPYEYGDDGELSEFEYALFMEEMEREERRGKRDYMSSLYDDGFEDDGMTYADDGFDGEYDDGFYEDAEQDGEDWDI